jgi:hypothetical protein
LEGEEGWKKRKNAFSFLRPSVSASQSILRSNTCIAEKADTMNDDEKYLFDLTGYLIIENALTPEDVARCNAAIDHHIDQLKE